MRAVDLKLADRVQGQLGQQRSLVGVKELVQGAADPVVVEQGVLLRLKAKQLRLECPDIAILSDRPSTKNLDVLQTIIARAPPA